MSFVRRMSMWPKAPVRRPAASAAVQSLLGAGLGGLSLAWVGAATAQEPIALPPIIVEAAEDGEAQAAASAIAARSTIDPDVPHGTGSRLPGTARDIPASVEAIDQDTMRRRGRQTWTTALQGLTGFTTATRPGASSVMSARGFTENGFALLYDGIRVGSTTISSRHYDSFTFDRIEVLRGPASVLYGEGAVGGAINLVRKRPSGAEEPFETLTSVSSVDGIRLGIGKSGVIGDQLSYRVDGVINSFDGPVDGNDITLGTLSGALTWDVTGRLSTTFDFDLMRTRIEDAYWGTPLVEGAIDSSLRKVNYNTLPNNAYDDDVRWLRWSVDYEASDALTLRNQLWSYQAGRDWINSYRFVHVPDGGSCSFRGQSIINDSGSDKVCRLTWENLAYDHSMLGNRFEAAWTGTLATLPLAAVAGIEVTSTRWDSPRSEVTSPQLVDPHHPEPTDFFDHGTGRTAHVRADLDQSAVFGEARVEIVPGVKLVGGLRADRLEVDYQRQPADQLYGRSYHPATYRAGVLWDIWRDTTLYAHYATAVEPRWALFTLGASDMAFTLTDARQVEVGIKQSFASGRAELLASLYHIDKTDIPSIDPATGDTVQIGEQSARGLEIAASWRPLDSLHLEANLALVDARYEEFRSGSADYAGNRPANVPATVANLGVSWQPVPEWSVGGWLHYRSAIMADDANSVSLPEVAVLDLFASYRLWDNAEVTFRVDNVTDEVYAAWATDASYVVLGNPRSYSLTLRTRF